MNPYAYELALRVNHPSADLKEIVDAIGALPGVAVISNVKAGDRRKTVDGKALEELCLNSYCFFSFFESIQYSDRTPLPEAIDRITTELMPHKLLLDGILETGGQARFLASLYVHSTAEVVFDVSLLQKLADFGADVRYQILPIEEGSTREG